MKTISEVWKGGELISRTESDDGILTLEEITQKIKEIELKLGQKNKTEEKTI